MATGYQSPRGIGATKKVIEEFAGNVASHFDFTVGDSLEDFVSARGGNIIFGSTGHEDYESGSIIANSVNDFTIYLSLNTSRLRDRFTIAHELGHLYLHLPLIKKTDANAVMRATRWVDQTDEQQKRAELEANWFAAAFLMPASKFKEVFKVEGVPGIVSTFDVSPSAAETRARTLGLA